MSLIKTGSVLTAQQASKNDPRLNELLHDLPADTPLTLDYLRERSAPGRPLDRLNACLIIMNYMRVEKP